MTISELIAELQKIKEKDGDLNVMTQSLTHLWAPELKVRRTHGDKPWLLLNA